MAKLERRAFSGFGTIRTEGSSQTGLLQLAAFSFRTIKYWSGFAGDFESASSKCSAKNGKKICFMLLKS